MTETGPIDNEFLLIAIEIGLQAFEMAVITADPSMRGSQALSALKMELRSIYVQILQTKPAERTRRDVEKLVRDFLDNNKDRYPVRYEMLPTLVDGVCDLFSIDK